MHSGVCGYWGRKEDQLLPEGREGRAGEGRGKEIFVPFSSRVISYFQSFLSSFWAFIFFSFKTNFQEALPALRLMPELNKLQNGVNSKLRGVQPVSLFLQRSFCAANIRR